MPRPISALIDLPALSHNLDLLRQHAPHAKVCAVVKANAYGHGLERVLPALRSADALAMLDLSEAQRARSAGWRGPIWMLEGAFEARDLELCSSLGLWHTVHCDAQIDALSRHKTQVPHRIFLKMNSGMNRLGFPTQRYRSAWARLQALPQVDEISHMTHFSDADGERGVLHQWQVFQDVTRDLDGERSLANSAAMLRHPATQADWVRPGIALYGSSPDPQSHSSDDWGLRPVMTLQSQLIAVQHLQKGDTVGYGSLFAAEQPMRIGVVACGYAENVVVFRALNGRSGVRVGSGQFAGGAAQYRYPIGYNSYMMYIAMWAQRYLHETGQGERDLGAVAVPATWVVSTSGVCRRAVARARSLGSTSWRRISGTIPTSRPASSTKSIELEME